MSNSDGLYLQLAPEENANDRVAGGDAEITVAIDCGESSVSDKFLLSVTPVEDAPSLQLASSSPVVMAEGSTTATMALLATSVDGAERVWTERS